MEKHELILSLIKDYNVGAEVGTLRGELSKKILENWSGRLYLIDAWRHFPDLTDFNNLDHNGQLDNMAKTFMSVYDFGERAYIIRDTSISASRLFSPSSLDFVYIDAAHDRKSVKEDLASWYLKVKDGGLVMGDDYFNGFFAIENGRDPDTLIEVKSAVDEFAHSIGKKVNFADTTHPSLTGNPMEAFLKQWWIKK